MKRKSVTVDGCDATPRRSDGARTSKGKPHASRTRRMTAEGEGKPRVQRMGNIVNQLMSRRGYGQNSATEQLTRIICEAIDPAVAESIVVGRLRRGVLQLYAQDSVTLQELNFQKRRILKRLQAEYRSAKISDLKFRIQA